MPLYLCNCGHEFENSRKDPKCDWCGETELKVLEEETPLEKMVNDGSLEKIVMDLWFCTCGTDPKKFGDLCPMCKRPFR
jgi:hypothetical protein